MIYAILEKAMRDEIPRIMEDPDLQLKQICIYLHLYAYM